jgi:hypothetical protein
VVSFWGLISWAWLKKVRILNGMLHLVIRHNRCFVSYEAYHFRNLFFLHFFGNLVWFWERIAVISYFWMVFFFSFCIVGIQPRCYFYKPAFEFFLIRTPFTFLFLSKQFHDIFLSKTIPHKPTVHNFWYTSQKWS